MIDKNNYSVYLYNKLPAVYREEDEKLGKPLYRYLESLCAGGFEKVIEDSNNFLNLIDPEKCPEEFFQYLYGSFGLTYFNDIPMEYHRKFLRNIGELIKRRGTKTAIKYLVSTLTGFEVDLFYERQYNEEKGRTDRVLNIVYYVNTLEDLNSVEFSSNVIEQFVKSQLPFYITPSVSAHVKIKSNIEARSYKSGAMSSYSDISVSPQIL